jgi:hypothetical protein
MSVSINMHAIPIDGGTYRKHKAVLDACLAAGVPVPTETAEFIDESPDGEDERSVRPDGIYISIHPYSDFNRKAKVSAGDAWTTEGVIIDLAKLPPGTTKICVSTEG